MPTDFPRRASAPPRTARRESGVALVLTLALIVVATVIVTAFFFRTRYDAQGSAGYSSQVTAAKLAELGSAQVIASLIAEAEDGDASPSPIGTDENRVFIVDDPQKMVVSRRLSSSLANVASDPEGGFQNIVKQSVTAPDAGEFDSFAEVGINVSNVSTYDTALADKPTYRPLSGKYWSAPMLTVEEFQDTDVPNWIYVTAGGQTVTSAPGANADPEDRIVGRYAFNVYDVGGLLDINSAGFASDAGVIAGRKGSLIFADLPGLAAEVGANGFDAGSVAALNAWRYASLDWSPSSDPNNPQNDQFPSTQLQDLLRAGPMLASLGSYSPGLQPSSARVGQNAFLSRGDVIRYMQSTVGEADTEALMPYLTHFTRDINQPYYPWGWDGGRPSLMSGVLPSMTGPTQQPLANINAAPWLADGKFRIKQRFPLERLNLLRLSESGAPTEDETLIRRYFGLRREETGANSRWVYDPVQSGSGAAAPLRLLSEINPDSTDPDSMPNFFEMLYYAINAGSLGQQLGGVAPVVFGAENAPHARVTSASASRWEKNFDASTLMHVMRIGAAIIDQWDADPYPTRIEIGGRTVFGVEDIPYLHGFKRMNYYGTTQHELFYNRNTNYGTRMIVAECASFMHPQLWNPHSSQSGKTTPAAPVRFRVVPHAEPLADNDPPTTLLPWGIGSDFNRPAFWPVDLLPPQDSANGSWNYTLLYRTNQDNGNVQFKRENIEALANGGNWDTPDINPGLARTDYVQLDISGAEENALRKPLLIWTSPPTRPNDASVNGAVVEVFQGGVDQEPYPIAFAKSLNADPDPRSARLPRVGFRVGKYLMDTNPYTQNGQPTGQQQCDLNNRPQFFGDSQVRVNFQLQYEAADGSWRPYDIIYDTVDFESPRNQNFGAQDQVWRVMGRDYDATFRTDPRVERFGPQSQAYRVDFNNTTQANDVRNFPPHSTGMDPSGQPWYYKNALEGGVTAAGIFTSKSQQGYNFTVRSGLAAMQWPLNNLNSLRLWNWTSLSSYDTFGIQNTEAMGYRDPDGQIRFPFASTAWRPNDPTTSPLYLPAGPYSTAVDPQRPVILNRPFQSVAEMGYASRDLPWKSIDFWNANSGDTALLDYFCLAETEADPTKAPLVAGVINLNSAPPEVIAALISGVNKYETLTDADPITWSEALGIATEITNFLRSEDSAAGPLRSRAEIVGNWKPEANAYTGPFTGSFPPTGARSDVVNSASVREAVGSDIVEFDPRRVNLLRALTDATTTRVWNLMIDVTAQSGRLPPDSSDLNDMVLEGSTRKWVFVAIDRATGKIIDQRVETAD